MNLSKRKGNALQRPYQTRARARVMGEAEKVQEKMKAKNGGHKRANGHNNEGHDEREEDNGSQCGCNCRYQRCR